MNFKELSISEALCNALVKENINEPTQVQIKTARPVIEGRDVIVSSSTGSGKTLAYLLPILSKIDLSAVNIQCLVLVPTQELAVQVNEQIMRLFSNGNIPAKSTFLIGEGNISRQIDNLKSKPVIVTGTPARIVQLLKLKKIKLHEVKTLILDEADKLTDKTYYDNILTIRKSLMKRTQVLLFSASINSKALKAANSLTVNPVIYDLNKKAQEYNIPKTIKHIYIVTDRRERIETLRKVAKALKDEKTFVFINTKYDLEEALQKLKYHNYNTAALYGNISGQEKKNAINDFKNGKINYLLATDVAARGLQIDNVNTVINVNLPEDTLEYLHRAGRCGRNGNPGLCVSIITENELNKIKTYQKKFNINIVQKKLYNGKLVAK